MPRDLAKKERSKTLRDEFAMAALMGLMADPQTLVAAGETGERLGKSTCQIIASISYEYADAMLEARK